MTDTTADIALWRHHLEDEADAAYLYRVLAAAEAAVFLAIILSIYREFGTIQPDRTDTLKG